MTPRERLFAALRGTPPDRVPINLEGCHVRVREGIASMADPRRRQVAERIFDETTFSVQVPSFMNRYLVTPSQRIRVETVDKPDGCKRHNGVIDTPKGELTFISEYDPASATGWMVEYPCKTLEDVEKIQSVPWEPHEQLAPPTDERPDGFETRGVVRTGVSTPMVCVAAMMKFEQFLEYTLTEQEWMLDLTRMCRDRALSTLEVLLSKPGIEYVWMGGSEWLTPPMGSPELYDLFVQEQERAVIDYVHEHSDAVVHVHCHGHVRHALQRTIERGGDYTEPVEPPPDGDITMREAKELAAGRITLGGNIECRVLCNEDASAVEDACRAAFEGGKERMIFKTTAGPNPVMEDREFENYMRMIDMWEELSPLS